MSVKRLKIRGQPQSTNKAQPVTDWLNGCITHSLTAARNRLWVVAPSMLTGHQQEPMRQQQ